MKPLYSQPYIFLWLSVPFILLLGISDFNEHINIDIYDTYFVVSNWDLAILISMLFALLGLIYWSVIKSGFRPIRWMTLTHLIFTIDISFFIWLVLFFNWFSQNDVFLISELSTQTQVIITCMGLFILGQILFVINIFLTLALKRSAAGG